MIKRLRLRRRTKTQPVYPMDEMGETLGDRWDEMRTGSFSSFQEMSQETSQETSREMSQEMSREMSQ